MARTKAPGIRVENIFIMAGVPMITQGMREAFADESFSFFGVSDLFGTAIKPLPR